ncbi:MAG: hypothetical protein ABL927_14985 [Bdellovibrionales bacterium]
MKNNPTIEFYSIELCKKKYPFLHSFPSSAWECCFASWGLPCQFPIWRLGTSVKGYDTALLQKQACKEGMRPLRLNGAEKVAKGLTTIEEVLRVAPQGLSL